MKTKPTVDRHGNRLRRSDRVKSLLNGHTLWIADFLPDGKLSTRDWDAKGATVTIYADYVEWMDSIPTNP